MREVVVKLRMDQAKALGKLLGQLRMVDLPNEFCRSIYAVTHGLIKEKQSIDVTTIPDGTD